MQTNHNAALTLTHTDLNAKLCRLIRKHGVTSNIADDADLEVAPNTSLTVWNNRVYLCESNVLRELSYTQCVYWLDWVNKRYTRRMSYWHGVAIAFMLAGVFSATQANWLLTVLLVVWAVIAFAVANERTP